MKRLFLLLLCLPCLTLSAADTGRPNIVVILLDNVGKEWFGCYGSEEKCTPNIDRLAAGGVRFANCYTTTVCGPSRVEMLTGRYPFHTGWYLHHDAALYSGGGFDPRRETTYARLLRDSGYATGMAGKWQVNNLYDEPDAITKHGFDEQLVWPGSIDRDKVGPDFNAAFQKAIAGNDADFLSKATQHIESRYWDPVLLRNGRREIASGRFGPDVFQEFAFDFYRRNREKPFLFYHAMVLTHGQNVQQHVVSTPDNRDNPPKEEHEMFADMLRYADKQVGAIVAELERLDLLKRTIVIIASDNGTEKSLSARANGREVQGSLYQINEAGGNVPLIIHSPQLVRGGRTAPLADFTDILPTICDLAGAKPPASLVLDGKSFAPFLRGEGAAPRKWIFNHYADERVARDGRFKLTNSGSLYDLEADPAEQKPLPPDASGPAAAARTKLQAVLDQMPPSTPLPFPHRSLSAFKKRAEAAQAGAK
ncbi:sulfatase-like hydrolase/transferase [Prosthecobacter sp.]|uniref:sulfatase-like hydrolase/transferase n=1 Tax=Prosthecobacter sp. TaxID=1965333 RepID=UPI003784A1E3